MFEHEPPRAHNVIEAFRPNERHKPSTDLDELAKAVDKILTRPRNYASWIDGPFTTHGPVATMAVNADDLVAESNWHVMRSLLEGTIAQTGSDSGDLFDTRESHWAFGPLDVLYVRVFAEPKNWRSPDPYSVYTPAFRAAVDLVSGLVEYPLLDESDYSDRQYAAWEAVVNDAIDTASRDFDDDPAVDQAVYVLLTTGGPDDAPDLFGLFSHGECHPDSVDWDAVAAAWSTTRDEFYEWLAARHWAAETAAPAGQLALPIDG